MLTRRTALLTALLLASTFALFLNADFLSHYTSSPTAVPLGENAFGKPLQMPGGQGGAVVNPDGGAVAVSDGGEGSGGLAVANGKEKEKGEGEKEGGNNGKGGFGGENGEGGLGAVGGGNADSGFGGDKTVGLDGLAGGNADGELVGNTGGLDGNNQSSEAGSIPPPVVLPEIPSGNTNTNTDALPPSGENTPKLAYFDQAFSVGPPPLYNFSALKAQCARTKWHEDDVYLHCGGMAAGLTSIMSQVKVCFKMAFEAGTGIILPSMPLRDSNQLLEFNFMNPDAYMTYDKWFDAAHFIDSVARVCPQMKIVHPDQLNTPEFPVKHEWHINLEDAKGYKQFESYFWTGRPFVTFFEEQFARLKQLDALNQDNKHTEGEPPAKGLTTIKIASNFLIFRVTDDPTGQDLKLWSDLSHLIRFMQPTRELVAELMGRVKRPYYGVHFRVESDTIWSSLENQLKVDLDALDEAWEMFGTPGGEKPLVYLACGDQDQVKKFVEAGSARGWEVTHKWILAAGDKSTLDKIDALPFDFQGAVDMGLIVRSDFFLGITGSAFSSTIGNVRDVTGRYRGSSLLLGKEGDGGARTHLFNDVDATHYACCL